MLRLYKVFSIKKSTVVHGILQRDALKIIYLVTLLFKFRVSAAICYNFFLNTSSIYDGVQFICMFRIRTSIHAVNPYPSYLTVSNKMLYHEFWILILSHTFNKVLDILGSTDKKAPAVSYKLQLTISTISTYSQ